MHIRSMPESRSCWITRAGISLFLRRTDADTIIGIMIMLIQKKLPRYVGAKPSEIQVMTPTRKGNLGVERLNVILQRYLNPADPKKNEAEIGDRLFREGDKVMQIKNNYQLEWEVTTRFGLAVDSGTGIFNGDMGVITEISTHTQRRSKWSSMKAGR